MGSLSKLWHGWVRVFNKALIRLSERYRIYRQDQAFNTRTNVTYVCYFVSLALYISLPLSLGNTKPSFIRCYIEKAAQTNNTQIYVKRMFTFSQQTFHLTRFLTTRKVTWTIFLLLTSFVPCIINRYFYCGRILMEHFHIRMKQSVNRNRLSTKIFWILLNKDLICQEKSVLDLIKKTEIGTYLCCNKIFYYRKK